MQNNRAVPITELLSPRICTRVGDRCLVFTHCITIFINKEVGKV